MTSSAETFQHFTDVVPGPFPSNRWPTFVGSDVSRSPSIRTRRLFDLKKWFDTLPTICVLELSTKMTWESCLSTLPNTVEDVEVWDSSIWILLMVDSHNMWKKTQICKSWWSPSFPIYEGLRVSIRLSQEPVLLSSILGLNEPSKRRPFFSIQNSRVI